MREVLSDVVRQTVGLFDKLRITGTDTETMIEAVSEAKVLFLKATLNEPLKEAEGVWGLTDLTLLNGLLNYAPYRADGATFTAKRREYNGKEVVENFEFREANKLGAVFRTIKGDMVDDIAQIGSIDWDVSFTPQKSNVAAFQQLSGLYSSVDKFFGIETRDGNLVFTIGDDNSATHRVEMVFENDVEGTIPSGMVFNVAELFAVIKQAGNHSLTMNITSRSAICMTVKTPIATYNYYIRAKR